MDRTVKPDLAADVLARIGSDPSLALERDAAFAVVRRRLLDDSAIPIPRYSAFERIGAGGLGVVYSAYDQELDRRVAIKVLGLDADDQQMRGEGRALASLSHPNVVEVFDVGTYVDAGARRTFIVMELIDGVDLTVWLDEKERSWSEIVAVFVDAGRGLAAAHARGLVHRDFKLSNVMVGPSGRVRVVDFGLAQRGGDSQEGSLGASPLTARDRQPGLIAGTPEYMSPEQHVGDPADARSDQYSFCVALYKALYNSRPLPTGDTRSLITAKFREDVTAPPRGRGIPRWLFDLLRVGLRSDPSRRHSSMSTVVDALERRAPQRRRLRTAVALSLLGATVVVAAVQLGQSACDRGEMDLREAWDPEGKARAEQAFEATGLRYAPTAWASTRTALDAHADRWVAAMNEACVTEAAAERQCLRRARDRLRAFSEELQHANATTVQHAAHGADKLADDLDCSHPTVAAPSAEDSREAARRIASARALLELGRMPDARDAADDALVLAREAGEAGLIADALGLLARATHGAGDSEGSLPIFEEATHLALRTDDDLRVAEISTYHGATLGAVSRFDHADRAFRTAQAASQRVGDPAPVRALLLQFRGSVAILAGRNVEAREDLREALDLRIHAHGRNTPTVAELLSDLGIIAANESRLDAAKDLGQQALAMRRTTLGESHPAVADSLTNLGGIERTQGNLERALELHREALAIYREALHADHPDVAVSLTNVALAIVLLETPASAIPLYEEAREIFVANFGSTHRRVAEVDSALATALEGAGRVEEALDAHNRAITVGQAALGSDHQLVAFFEFDLSQALFRLGDYERARAGYQRCVEALEHDRKPSHPLLGLALSRLGLTLIRLDRPAEAVEALERGAGLLASEGPQRPDASETLATARHNLALARRAAGTSGAGGR